MIVPNSIFLINFVKNVSTAIIAQVDVKLDQKLTTKKYVDLKYYLQWMHLYKYKYILEAILGKIFRFFSSIRWEWVF